MHFIPHLVGGDTGLTPIALKLGLLSDHALIPRSSSDIVVVLGLIALHQFALGSVAVFFDFLVGLKPGIYELLAIVKGIVHFILSKRGESASVFQARVQEGLGVLEFVLHVDFVDFPALQLGSVIHVSCDLV